MFSHRSSVCYAKVVGKINAVRSSNFKSLFLRMGRVSVGVGGGGEVKNKVGGVDAPLLAELTALSSVEEYSPTPRVFSKSRSCPIKLKLGETLLLRCLTKS